MQEEIVIDPDCEACGGKCCVGDIEVMPNEPLYGNETVTEPVSGKPYDRVMRTAIDGRCTCLVGGKCSIYDSRPVICRRFQLGSPCCVAFFSGRKTAHACDDCVLYALSEDDAADIADTAVESVEAGFEDAGVELPEDGRIAISGILMAFVSKFIRVR